MEKNNLETLEKIVQFIYDSEPKTKVRFDDARRKICSKLKISQPANNALLPVYHKMLKNQILKKDTNFEFLLRKANIRTLSGVAVVTSLAKPFVCPGKCIYCPNENNMPKSYIASEPAAARALALKFSPYEQMKKRIEMLEKNGHPTDKIEFIIKGGSWNSYDIKYQYWFILESFKACNDFKRRKKLGESKISDWKNLSDLEKALQKEQNYNETANHRIIGLTLETRPDLINPENIYHMRRQGSTRIELGLQATDDKILQLNKRGHTLAGFKQAILLLRQAGFKVDLHFMPALFGSNPKKDVKMYQEIFSDPGLKPDMIKIYPCVVTKNTELYKLYNEKKYKPYSEKQLFESIIEMKTNTPRYCRISRLIRDIPNQEIIAGNSVTNLRENLQKEMKKRNLICNCLRCREIGHNLSLLNKNLKPKLFIDEYQTIGGLEYFLSFEDKNRQVVFAFLRLRIPDSKENNSVTKLLTEIKSTAFIRELHTYGQLMKIGITNTEKGQHRGLGKKLLLTAEKIVKRKKFDKIAIISGVGVRNYYTKNGYQKKGTYMIKKLVS
ncbi:MAG: tRNA uridine(34) 5-carboxymethylaminomethyl modification radical SAM/GNAT enzyme Elp3 [Patescibacteria group bacterium]